MYFKLEEAWCGTHFATHFATPLECRNTKKSGAYWLESIDKTGDDTSPVDHYVVKAINLNANWNQGFLPGSGQGNWRLI